MKRNKKLLVAAAAGALTVAAAVPAFALENEFHGSFTAFYDLSNFTAAGNDGFEQIDANNPIKASKQTQNATGLQKSAPTENYFVQRARLAYTAKASEQVKLVTQFELDYSFWGNSNFTTGRNSGGGIGADSVQIETKNIYLELNYPAINAKIGMMPYNDSLKGILFDDDMAGVLLSHNYSNASVAAGFFRFLDNGDIVGKNNYDMISLDAKYNVTKDAKVGLSYYYINDNRTNPDTVTRPVPAPATGPDPAVFGQNPDGSNVYAPGTFVTTTHANNQVKVHTIALNGEGVIGPVTLNGFAAAQFGDRSDTQIFDQSKTRTAKGYALNVGAKAPVFGGTLRSEFLYVGGGKNAWYVPGNDHSGTSGGAFYDGEMIMLLRDKNAKTLDTAVVFDVNNYNQGVILGTIGYDHACTDKITSSVNAGFAAVAKDGGATAPRSNSNFLGAELNLESNYKLNANTTLGIRGGYMFLGDYFRGLNADNPYDFKVIASYAF